MVQYEYEFNFIMLSSKAPPGKVCVQLSSWPGQKWNPKSMILVLIGKRVVLKEDFNLLGHLGFDILAQECQDDPHDAEGH